MKDEKEEMKDDDKNEWKMKNDIINENDEVPLGGGIKSLACPLQYWTKPTNTKTNNNTYNKQINIYSNIPHIINNTFMIICTNQLIYKSDLLEKQQGMIVKQ